MALECIARCFGRKKESVDIYNSSTWSQFNLVSHFQHAHQDEKLRENIYDNQFSVFRTVSNDSVPSFDVLEQNGRGISIIGEKSLEHQTEHRANKSALSATSSCPLDTNSKGSSSKAPLGATKSVPGSFKWKGVIPTGLEESGCQLSAVRQIDVSLFQPAALTRLEAVNARVSFHSDSSSTFNSSTEVSVEGDYESFCCGFWPMKYKHSDLESLHYYEAVIARLPPPRATDMATQTDRTGKPDGVSGGDCIYEDVCYSGNGVTFTSVAEVHPTPDMISLDNEAMIHNEHVSDPSGSEMIRTCDDNTNLVTVEKIYDDAFSARRGSSGFIVDVAPAIEKHIGYEAHYGSVDGNVRTTTPVSDCAHSQNSKDKDSLVNSIDTELVYENLFPNEDVFNKYFKRTFTKTDRGEIIQETTKMYHDTESISSLDTLDECIYDDVGNTMAGSFEFIPHLEEVNVNNDIYDNVYDDPVKKTDLNESAEENLYDVVGSFNGIAESRYSAADIFVATQMLKNCDSEGIYENPNHAIDVSTENLSEVSDIRFEIGMTESDTSDSDPCEDNLYDMVGDVERGVGVLMRLSHLPVQVRSQVKKISRFAGILKTREK